MNRYYDNYFEYLPLLLKKRLIVLFNNLPEGYESFGRDFRSWNNCVKICSVVLFKQFELGSIGDSSLFYCGLSAGFWKDKRIIGNHYSRYINFLLDQQVLQRKWGRFYFDDGFVDEYGYRINPELNNGEYVIVEYKDRKDKPSEVAISEYDGHKPFKPEPFNLDKINIGNKSYAKKWVRENAERLVKDAITDNYYDLLPDKLSLAFTKLKEDGTHQTRYYSVKKAKEIAKVEDLSLFYYRNKNVISTKDYFLKQVIPEFTKHYLWRVSSFSSVKFNLSRHQKTRRVYGQTVSLPSTLLPFVRIHNQFIMQVDLKSSQFTIFANILNHYIISGDSEGEALLEKFRNTKSRDFITKLIKTFKKHKENLSSNSVDYKNPVEDIYYDEGNDVFQFLQDVFFHDFYNILKSTLNLSSRQHAKLWAFTILFGKETTNNIIKKQMMELYPTIVNIIDDFKRTYKSNQFSIGLQVLEAELFIDNIWKSAKTNHITSFTRHDSLVFAISKRSEVETIIAETQEKFQFIGSFNYEIFNETVIKKYGYYIPEEEFCVDELDLYTHYPHLEEHPFSEYYEDDIELMKQLVEIGIHDDYYGLIDLGMMENITELPFLEDSSKESRFLADEVWNMREGYSFFQETTNSILKTMITILSSINFDAIPED